MGTTRYFNMAFFDFGDQLDTPLNVQKEIDRFVLIDKQLYGLYNVFGNGVIDGWRVYDAGFTTDEGIGITISQGIGIINYLAAETHTPAFRYGLTPNSVLDVYATIIGSSVRDRAVNFIVSNSDLSTDNPAVIRIARLATGNNSILYINNNERDLISYEDIIEDQINQHRHRGTPSKIDLEEETKNQLPGARIEEIDASTITSGQFDINRIPIVDHNDLENNGMLTHAALDSFVRSLSQNNRELLGEIASINLLKMIIFLKYLYTSVDEQFINELAFIPGISPNSFIDFDSSTANINLGAHCISGLPVQTGIFTSVYWNTTYSFNTSYFTDNVTIANNEVTVSRTGENVEVVADFDNGICFEPEMVINSNYMDCSIKVEDGNELGRLGGAVNIGYYYRLNFNSTSAKNWSGQYDELVIKVKTSESIHSPVYMYVVNGSNLTSDGTSFGSIEAGNIEGIKKPSISWMILEENETMSDFEEKVFNISSLDLDNVTQITIYTNDSFLFDIDDIIVRRTNLLASNGTIRFRYETEANVVFHSLFYSVETPEDTSMSVRIKVSSSADLLSRASYSLPMNTGDVFAIEGRAVEIEMILTSNSDFTVSPVLSSVELRILTDADFTGFVIDSENEWERGTLNNVAIEESTGNNDDIVISSPVNVGGRYFMKNSSVSEISDVNIGVFGFSGTSMPISPNQAREWTTNSTRGFNKASSIVREYNKNYLIADTNNNRVLEVDTNGNLVKGFGSTYTIDTDFYPLSAIYNSTTNTLAMVFTKAATVNDITKISFYVGSSKFSLTTDDTIIETKKSGGKILEILLDDETSNHLIGVTSDLTINFETGAFTEDIVISEGEGIAIEGNSIFSVLRGIVCFVGNFTYIDNIRHPIFFNETISGNWIIANSSIFYGGVDETKEEVSIIPSILELDPDDVLNTESKLISSSIKFSDYTLGSIYEYEEDKFLVAGIFESSAVLGGVTGDALRQEYETVPESVEFRASAIDDLSSYKGKIMFFDKASNRSQTFYTSPDGLYPSDIDGYNNGDFLVSESSFADSSGRLIRLDSYGNITWVYGGGFFNIINDIKVLNDDNMIISV